MILSHYVWRYRSRRARAAVDSYHICCLVSEFIEADRVEKTELMKNMHFSFEIKHKNMYFSFL